MVKGCFLVTNVPFFALSALLYGGMMMSQSQTQQAPFFQEALFSNAGRDDGNIIAASKKILEVCLDLSVSDVHLEPQKMDFASADAWMVSCRTLCGFHRSCRML